MTDLASYHHHQAQMGVETRCQGHSSGTGTRKIAKAPVVNKLSDQDAAHTLVSLSSSHSTVMADSSTQKKKPVFANLKPVSAPRTLRQLIPKQHQQQVLGTKHPSKCQWLSRIVALIQMVCMMLLLVSCNTSLWRALKMPSADDDDDIEDEDDGDEGPTYTITLMRNAL